MATELASFGARAQLIKKLSPRMRETIRCLIQDYAVKEDVIADKLDIALPTLKTHIQRAYPKLGVSNRLELYALYHAFFGTALCGCAGAEAGVLHWDDIHSDD